MRRWWRRLAHQLSQRRLRSRCRSRRRHRASLQRGKLLFQRADALLQAGDRRQRDHQQHRHRKHRQHQQRDQAFHPHSSCRRAGSLGDAPGFCNMTRRCAGLRTRIFNR
jgi:hypothetical protein